MRKEQTANNAAFPCRRQLAPCVSVRQKEHGQVPDSRGSTPVSLAVTVNFSCTSRRSPSATGMSVTDMPSSSRSLPLYGCPPSAVLALVTNCVDARHQSCRLFVTVRVINGHCMLRIRTPAIGYGEYSRITGERNAFKIIVGYDGGGTDGRAALRLQITNSPYMLTDKVICQCERRQILDACGMV